jgi:hypothetical protein
MHPTGGSRRVFEQFAWLEVGSVKMALPRPAHQRVTPAVSQPLARTMIFDDERNVVLWKSGFAKQLSTITTTCSNSSMK